VPAARGDEERSRVGKEIAAPGRHAVPCGSKTSVARLAVRLDRDLVEAEAAGGKRLLVVRENVAGRGGGGVEDEHGGGAGGRQGDASTERRASWRRGKVGPGPPPPLP